MEPDGWTIAEIPAWTNFSIPSTTVSYTHLRAHETSLHLVCRLLLEKKIFFLEKDFKFKNFLDSQKFVNKVGGIAEEEGHHPDIIFGWGYAKIKITTHAIEGLSENDFILAAKIDTITNV